MVFLLSSQHPYRKACSSRGIKVAAPPLDSLCDTPVTYPGYTKILVKSSKGRSGPTLNTTTRPGLNKKNKGSEDIGNYMMIYCGVPANQWASSGVAIEIRKDWKHKIQDYTWISDRIIDTRIKVLNRNFTIVGLYAPVEGKEQDREEFYRELQQSMEKFLKKEILF